MNRVIFGDCRDTMRDLKAQGVRVQCCVTSPPYFGLRDYGHPGQIGLEKTPAEYVAALVEVFEGVRELLADDGVLWLNLGDGYAQDGQLRATAWRTALAMQDAGWLLRQDVVWRKPAPMPEPTKNRCTRAHEYVFMFSKTMRYFYDAAAVREPSVMKPQQRLTKREDHPKGDAGRGAHRRPPGGASYETRNRHSVWTIPTVAYRGAHFAVFPEELARVCILAGSRPGDVVLDPFMGSGTTAAVAIQEGRNWIGCELNTEYAPLQQARTAQAALAI